LISWAVTPRDDVLAALTGSGRTVDGPAGPDVEDTVVGVDDGDDPQAAAITTRTPVNASPRARFNPGRRCRR
jgi:hypothetical protein